MLSKKVLSIVLDIMVIIALSVALSFIISGESGISLFFSEVEVDSNRYKLFTMLYYFISSLVLFMSAYYLAIRVSKVKRKV